MPEAKLDEAPGYEQLAALLGIIELNSLKTDLPLLRGTASQSKLAPWDYEGRILVMWVHIIASAYGWALDQIRDLFPDEALAFIQEILVDEQLQREWEHAHSPVSYKHDRRGKAELLSTPRPGWMKVSGPPKPTRIPRRLIPTGTIIDLSGVTQGGPSGVD